MEEYRTYNVDRATESRSIIFEKGLAYRTVFYDSKWQATYRSWPTPLWIVPTMKRLASVNYQWEEAWPEGRWYMTTDTGLKHDDWYLYDGGDRRCVSLFEDWEFEGQSTLIPTTIPEVATKAPPRARDLEAFSIDMEEIPFGLIEDTEEEHQQVNPKELPSRNLEYIIAFAERGRAKEQDRLATRGKVPDTVEETDYVP